MRKHYTKVLKAHFHRELFRRRTELEITQEEMAEKLAMDTRTYVYLDHGITSCSALTLALFLIYISDDPLAFLNQLKLAFEENPNAAELVQLH